MKQFIQLVLGIVIALSGLVALIFDEYVRRHSIGVAWERLIYHSMYFIGGIIIIFL